MPLASGASTHVGRRTNNEDSLCHEPDLGLFAVADGMGGYEGGEVASRLVVTTLADFVRRNVRDRDVTWPFALDRRLSLAANIVQVAVRIADAEVRARRKGRLKEMGSTLAALLVSEGEVVVAHVGDSRVYRLRGGVLAQLTRDHSLYAEMQAAGMRGLASREDCSFRNVITRAIGMPGRAVPDLRCEPVVPGDVYLLCSDGLIETVSDEGLRAVLAAQPPDEAGRALVQEAFERGSRDNITAVVVAAVAGPGDRRGARDGESGVR